MGFASDLFEDARDAVAVLELLSKTLGFLADLRIDVLLLGCYCVLDRLKLSL